MAKRGWLAVATALMLTFSAMAMTGGARPALASGIETERGPETGLPLPRYVSLKSSEGRARRGPNRTHRVDWIYTRRDIPLRVTAEFEHWRRVEDHEGQGGWMHYSLLSGVRTALVMADMAPMLSHPRDNAPQVALLESGVVARIMSCDPDWCRVRAENLRGWVAREALWGVDPHEVLD